jgi:hypothetical protein
MLGFIDGVLFITIFLVSFHPLMKRRPAVSKVVVGGWAG